ncbi:PH domain-containing protein [Jatrophihabitans telluris]|uniref:PH domain-containing protein n=1 Tax=Jatrophihabitans telluris TaxID=2038343 RepID=A0ABY4R1L9_9ACTN|nr:PH domain-containing protein [Jatrophihabitans telluris]UQX89705.1 PH domain-containing protein [Jatrophihabitans telluris]
MNDLDRYLLPTETTEVVVRRHWASLTKQGLIAAALIALSMTIVVYAAKTQALAVLGTLLFLGTIGWFGWIVGDWYSERFVITDKRVLLISGLLTKRVAIMPLSKVTDLTYERSIPGRLLGYGVFVVESAGQHQALSRIDFLPHPDELYQQVSSLLFGPRQRIGRGPAPSDGSSRSGGEGYGGGYFAGGYGGDYESSGFGRASGYAPGAADEPTAYYGGMVGGQVQDQSTTPLPKIN